MAEEAAAHAPEHDLRYHQGSERMGFPTGELIIVVEKVFLTFTTD